MSNGVLCIDEKGRYFNIANTFLGKKVIGIIPPDRNELTAVTIIFIPL